ncbi:molybdenum cofactor guanylyltransferase [Alteromonas flava]|uniref:molybdenum cofactor guanylyltransferase n=1 Tax=Alteromonas flava TaxID=2048003 RepID=UPI000C2946FE|nr:molybdenum cofactor guanylyltransferase [Alteromonas flava]
MSFSANFDAVILAGGESSRMQQDKASLVVNGESFLSRQRALALAVGAHRVIIAGRAGVAGGIPDQYPGMGPLSGIQSGLSCSQHGILVLPIDMPLLTVKLVKRLCQQGLKTHKISLYKGYKLPLFVPNTNLIRDTLTQQLSAGDNVSLGKFLALHECHHLPVTEQTYFANVNTPAEWQQVQRIMTASQLS